MLLTYLKMYKSFIIIAVFVATIGGLYAKIKITQHQRDVARAQLATLSAQVETQNAAVQRWKKEADKQSKRLHVAMQEAQKSRNMYQKEAHAILTQSVSSDCVAAINWAARMAKDLNSVYQK